MIPLATALAFGHLNQDLVEDVAALCAADGAPDQLEVCLFDGATFELSSRLPGLGNWSAASDVELAVLGGEVVALGPGPTVRRSRAAQWTLQSVAGAPVRSCVDGSSLHVEIEGARGLTLDERGADWVLSPREPRELCECYERGRAMLMGDTCELRYPPGGRRAKAPREIVSLVHDGAYLARGGGEWFLNDLEVDRTLTVRGVADRGPPGEVWSSLPCVLLQRRCMPFPPLPLAARAGVVVTGVVVAGDDGAPVWLVVGLNEHDGSVLFAHATAPFLDLRLSEERAYLFLEHSISVLSLTSGQLLGQLGAP